MQLFYCPEIEQDIFWLNPEESKHCLKVLRMQEGDKIYITDGKGAKYEAILEKTDPKKCKFRITNHKKADKAQFNLTIAIAPTKNISRFEWFLEKATELGVSEIIPMFCKHSERGRINQDRIGKIIITAMKQSFRAWLPKITEMISFEQVINNNFNGKKLIAYITDDDTIHLKDAVQPGENVMIMIGPEGDFSPEEVENAKKHKFQLINLGPNRLRTETAGVVAVHTVNLINL
ncbi:MAG: 16S rRNA (uracil(1498)-N(3))-methyltransferase [Bacteroidales bacterium]|nr:16S rRNA (uracil(1498)-N(3))-methyltransferase [Bacteroidales bacterium]